MTQTTVEIRALIANLGLMLVNVKTMQFTCPKIVKNHAINAVFTYSFDIILNLDF